MECSPFRTTDMFNTGQLSHDLRICKKKSTYSMSSQQQRKRRWESLIADEVSRTSKLHEEVKGVNVRFPSPGPSFIAQVTHESDGMIIQG